MFFEIFKRYQIPKNKKIVLVTFHPETNSNISIIKQIDILIYSLKFFKDLYFIITYNNMDSGGLYFINRLKALNKKHQNLLLIKSLGSRLYYEFIENVDLVMGNSSSGIIEVPSLGVPTINVGSRQLGRLAASSVINCEPSKSAIIFAISSAIGDDYKNPTSNPYGQGNASGQIIDVLKSVKFKKIKKFFNIKVD